MEIRKVPPSAGAEWLLGGFALLRKSPLGLGLLGAIYGTLSVIAALMAQTNPTGFLVMQLALMLAGPLLLAGMIFAAREVDEGRSALPVHLLRGMQEGKTLRLLGTLLPQIGAVVACAVLLVLMVGPAQLQHIAAIAQQLQGQVNPDPELIKQLPAGRLFLWMLCAIVIGILAGFFNFTAMPEMMFSQVRLFPAMQRSFRACLRNLPALIVFFLLLIVVAIALSIGVQLVAFIAKLIAGDTAMQVVSSLLLMAVLMPVVTGAIYIAWKQMLQGGAQSHDAAPTTSGIEA